MVDFIITDFESVRGGGNIVDTVPSAEDFIVDNCTISSSSSGVFVLTPGESLVGTVSLSANKTSITVGESVVFSATVEDTDGEPLEDLTVSFYRDGVSLGSGVSDDTGMVQLTVSSWSVGSFTCTASCQGVSSSGVTVTVSKITSTISLSAVSSTISVGDSPQLTGTLSVGSGESVKIYLGDVLADTVTTGTNGAFSFTGSATSTSGSLTFKAVYDGDSTHSSVTSSNVVITVSDVTPVVSTVSLSSDKSILSYADSESAVLSATVLDGNDDPMEGETVTFYKGSTSIGTATTNSSGIATKTYSATGAGDVTFKASVGMIVSETFSLEDAIYFNTMTSAPSGWTIPTNANATYSSNGMKLQGSAWTDCYLEVPLTKPYSVEFDLTQWTGSTTYPNYFWDSTKSTRHLQMYRTDGGKTVLDAYPSYNNSYSGSIAEGSHVKIEINNDNAKLYVNDELKLTKSYNMPSSSIYGVAAGTNRTTTWKNIKIKPL